MRKERGHALLYLLFFAPLLLGIGSIAYDLSVYSSLQNTLQSELDRVTLSAANALPNRDLARQIARNGLLQLDLSKPEIEITASPVSPEISVEISASHETGLLSFLGQLSGAQSDPMKVSAHASAQLVPVDAAIIISDGVDMRPWLDSSGAMEPPWGDALEWPASSALDQCLRAPSNRFSNDPSFIRALWTTESGRRWLTQSCFNPVFSNFKYTAMSLADLLTGIETNRAAVIFTPASENGVSAEAVRHIHSASLSNQESGSPDSGLPETTGGFIPHGAVPTAVWQPYRDFELDMGDEACVLFSDPLTAVNGAYSLNELRSLNSSEPGCAAPVTLPECGENESLISSRRLSQDCLSRSSLAEIIYYRAAKHPSGEFNAVPDIFAALRTAESELLDPGPQNSQQPGELQNIEKLVRGNLAARPIRVVFVLTDDLPPLDTLPAELDLLRRAGVSLIVASVNRASFSSIIAAADTQEVRAKQWDSYLKTHPPEQLIPDRLFKADSPEQLYKDVLPFLAAAIHRVALKS